MKVIGITRRMDDLGRVVIPKEVRQSLGINEGDFLKICPFRGISFCLFSRADRAGWARSDFFWISSFNKICSQMLCNLTIDTSPEICYTI